MHMDLLDTALSASGSSLPLYAEFENSTLPWSPQPVAWWRREPDGNPPRDLEALDLVAKRFGTDGYVIDVGCCTGRHLGILANGGISGHGIDTSPAAVRLATSAGIDCTLVDAWQYQPPGPVNAVLLLGGNGGLSETFAAFPAFLERLASWLTPDGVIVFSSLDWRLMQLQPSHRRPGEGRRPEGAGFPGDRRARLHFGTETGAWFQWVFVDQKSLDDVCRKVGLRVAERLTWSAGMQYTSVLERNP